MNIQNVWMQVQRGVTTWANSPTHKIALEVSVILLLIVFFAVLALRLRK